MKKYFLVLLISAITFAQNNKQNIRGIVTDKLSQSPLIGATIQLSNSESYAITDENGKYQLSDIAPGRYVEKTVKLTTTFQSKLTIDFGAN